jgi:hypothetical protein
MNSSRSSSLVAAARLIPTLLFLCSLYRMRRRSRTRSRHQLPGRSRGSKATRARSPANVPQQLELRRRRITGPRANVAAQLAGKGNRARHRMPRKISLPERAEPAIQETLDRVGVRSQRLRAIRVPPTVISPRRREPAGEMPGQNIHRARPAHPDGPPIRLVQRKTAAR